MITTTQAAAKQEAREHFTVHFLTEEAGSDAPTLLNPALAGIGVAGETLRVYVLEERASEVEVPDRFGDLSTETILTAGFQAVTPPPRRQTRIRPTPCGVSVGHVSTTAGTLGCLVEVDGQRYVLSNNHVLADTSNGTPGDSIVQPGPLDGGTSQADDIAILYDFEPIDFAGAANRIDAAIASVIDPSQVDPSIMVLGLASNPPIAPSMGQDVAKHGRTTGFTIGYVVDVSFDGYVSYGAAGTAWFEDQIVIESDNGRFSEPGDSGSLIVHSPTSHPVALLFAGDEQRTLGNPIDQVLNCFGGTVVGR